MAEYMDISRIDDWNDLSIIDDDGNAKYVYDVGELPRANVVEREKIDKAIEEMKALANPENTILGFDEKMGVKVAMNILVRNIRNIGE